MHCKGILFDLDGTLLDTAALIFQSVQYAMRLHCNKEADPDVVRAYFGKPLRELLALIAPGKVEEAVKTYRQYNLRHHDQLARAFPGVSEVLAELHRQQVPMAVVTSKFEELALRGLRLSGLEPYFSAIVTQEQCQQHKPHPEPVQRGVAALGLAPADCLMVGDSPFDIISGRAAGCQTAAVCWTEVGWQAVAEAKPDYILDDVRKLITIAGCKPML